VISTWARASPALLPGNLVWIAGKDGLQRVLNLTALDGSPPDTTRTPAASCRPCRPPAASRCSRRRPLWHDLLFVADGGGTSAYRVSGRALALLWQNTTPGTSPVLAGGLLYVYDPSGSGIAVYEPASGHVITTLAAASRALEQPDRRRRSRDRADRRRQRPPADRLARDLLDPLATHRRLP